MRVRRQIFLRRTRRGRKRCRRRARGTLPTETQAIESALAHGGVLRIDRSGSIKLLRRLSQLLVDIKLQHIYDSFGIASCILLGDG